MTCRGPRGPHPEALPTNVVGIRDGLLGTVAEPLDPIEALMHIRTFVEVLEDGEHGLVVDSSLREIRALLDKALSKKPRRS
ncbi:hypothetical protein [Methylobacterium sp. E-016]|uniref:hypothetical protein n=1 Tax=Methylobacterium sp. E-016 TaxID=2836556 RepID=UPI001FBB714F|nr:hypothetical protein [Methylobacterium sp. E-016]